MCQTTEPGDGLPQALPRSRLDATVHRYMEGHSAQVYGDQVKNNHSWTLKTEQKSQLQCTAEETAFTVRIQES